VTLILDQTTVDATARSAGLDVPEGDESLAEAELKQLKANFEEIALSLLNYHDTFNAFPRADGDADGGRIDL